MKMDREQLEALRRQVEEDYRLDLAAIERLQRRYLGAASSIPSSTPSNSVPVSAYSSPGKWSEEAESRIEPPSPLPPKSAPAEWQRDELEGSLRTMFNGGRPVGR
jgi:hypothetical protein